MPGNAVRLFKEKSTHSISPHFKKNSRLIFSLSILLTEFSLRHIVQYVIW